MKLRTIIVDDEPHAIEIIAGYLKNFPEIAVVAECSNGINAFQVLRQQQVDLMFLDIKMPGLNGNELVRSLKNPPKVIFTTAYREYAVDGFDLNAVDYLLKPIPFERFLCAMQKVFAGMQTGTAAVNKLLEVVPKPEPAAHHDIFLYLKIDRKMVKVNVDDIYWIESLKDYVKVILKDKVLQSKQKISLLEELLPEDKFLRIHRSYIVSIAKIESYQSTAVGVLGQDLPIGRNYKANCQIRLQAI